MPLPLFRYPELTSSLKPGEYYTQETVKEVVQYAKERGIRVIPEMDIPYDSSHQHCHTCAPSWD